jgi:hypothetical protein
MSLQDDFSHDPLDLTSDLASPTGYRPNFETDAVARIDVSGILPHARDWTVETFPGHEPETVRVLTHLERWVEGSRRVQPGVVLYGAPGTGKTGLAIAAIHAGAEAPVGRPSDWYLATFERMRRLIAQGTHREPVAPVWYESWPHLRDRLEIADRGEGLALPFEPPWIRQRLVGELVHRDCHLLAIDDIDSDPASWLKEETLIALVERPLHGLRVLVTMTQYPEQVRDRLGARVVDRLMDRASFARVPLKGRSLRELARHGARDDHRDDHDPDAATDTLGSAGANATSPESPKRRGRQVRR